MTFSVDPVMFRDAVAWTARWIPTRPVQPVWAGMLLSVESGRLTLAAFDQDVRARAAVPVEGPSGSAVVSGRLLSELSATLPTVNRLRVMVEDKVMSIGADRVVVSLPLIDETYFPASPGSPPIVARVSGTDLARAADRVAPVAAKDEFAAALTTVRLLVDGGESGSLELLASDSRRVARTSAAASVRSTAEALVPAAVLAEVTRTFQSDRVLIGVGGGLASFAVVDRMLTVRLGVGPYPLEPVRKAVEIEPPVTVELSVIELRAALRRALVVRLEKQPVLLNWSSGALTVTVSDGATHVRQELEADYHEPANASVGVNPEYLLTALATFDKAKTVRVAFDPRRPNRPILITDPGDDAYRHVLVPIDLSRSKWTPTGELQ